MIIKTFRAICPQVNLIVQPNHFFSQMKNLYPVLSKSHFSAMEKKYLYLYRIQQMKGSEHIGLVARTPVDEFDKGHIIPHELTLEAKENRQLGLFEERNGFIKPILLTYPDVDDINILAKKYIKKRDCTYEVSYKLEKHSFWAIKDKKVADLFQKLFKEQVSKTYIADGHHRVAVSRIISKKNKAINKDSVSDKDFMLTALFPKSQLEVHNFNRVVGHLGNHTPNQFLAALSKVVDIEMLGDAEKPQQKHEITMSLNQIWFRLQWKKEILNKYSSKRNLLDVALLNKEILNNILGVDDIQSNDSVKYVEGPKGLASLEGKSRYTGVAFSLFPVQLENLMDISDEGGIMPPKSTWFEPRIRNGLIVYEYKD